MINVTRNLAKIWKSLIIFFGMNFSFSVIRIVIMIIGIMFIRIRAKVNFIGWSLICISEYIVIRLLAI